MPSRWTMKNGILVPSFDVASICPTTSPVGSNIAGSRLISDTPPFSAVTHSVAGRLKLVHLKKSRLDRDDLATTPTVPSSGAGTQPPHQAPGRGPHARSPPRT